MAIALLFLVSSIVTARYLEKRKMSMASVLYSILFILSFIMILFALDYPFINTGLTNIFGAVMFEELRCTMQGIVSMSIGGFSLTSLFGVVCALQVAFVVFGVTRHIVVHHLIVKKLVRRFIKAYIRFALLVRNLYLPKRINLLYCRMLN